MRRSSAPIPAALPSPAIRSAADMTAARHPDGQGSQRAEDQLPGAAVAGDRCGRRYLLLREVRERSLPHPRLHVLDTHPPNQRAQLGLDWRPPSPSTRFPTPVATKAGPVPRHERLGPHDRENPEDCWKPTIQLDKEPSIMVRQPDATMQPTPQYDQLMSYTVGISTAFSASSRNLDLNGEARTARTKQNSPIIPSTYAIPSRHQLR